MADEQAWTDDQMEDEGMQGAEAREPEKADAQFGETLRSSQDVSDDVAQSQPQAPEEVDELDDDRGL